MAAPRKRNYKAHKTNIKKKSSKRKKRLQKKNEFSLIWLNLLKRLKLRKSKTHKSKKHIVFSSNLKYLIGISFILLGIFTVFFPILFNEYTKKPTDNDKVVKFLNTDKNSNTLVNSVFHIDSNLISNSLPAQPPQRIVIPILNIDLQIVEAPVIDGFWELSETSASHGIGSANPGETGNIVIFAHAREELFEPLRDIKINDKIYVFTKDRWYQYHVSDSKLVNPDEIEVISQTTTETLTLFTCSGFLDSKRLIVKAEPIY